MDSEGKHCYHFITNIGVLLPGCSWYFQAIVQLPALEGYWWNVLVFNGLHMEMEGQHFLCSIRFLVLGGFNSSCLTCSEKEISKCRNFSELQTLVSLKGKRHILHRYSYWSHNLPFFKEYTGPGQIFVFLSSWTYLVTNQVDSSPLLWEGGRHRETWHFLKCGISSMQTRSQILSYCESLAIHCSNIPARFCIILY